MTTLTIQDAIDYALARLQALEAARLETEILLAHALGKTRSHILAWPESRLDESQQLTFQNLIERRQAGEPIAYLIGRREFWDLDLRVTPDTLIPRPETEHLVELALQLIPADAHWRIADLGTGSGAIALAIAKHRNHCLLTATDISKSALDVARHNAAQHQLSNVEFRQGDWFDVLGAERFHLIMSNPPYVAEADPHLQQGDLRFEPRSALSAGPDGLDDIRRIIAASPAHLEPGGWLLLEHGYDQGDAVARLLHAHGFSRISCDIDYAERERVSYGQFHG